MSRQRALYLNLVASNPKVAEAIKTFRKSNKKTFKKRK